MGNSGGACRGGFGDSEQAVRKKLKPSIAAMDARLAIPCLRLIMNKLLRFFLDIAVLIPASGTSVCLRISQNIAVDKRYETKV
jgi:hypothetical protein